MPEPIDAIFESSAPDRCCMGFSTSTLQTFRVGPGATFPSAYAKQQARLMVEQLAQRGAVDVSGLIEHDAAIIWPMLRVQAEVLGGAERCSCSIKRSMSSGWSHFCSSRR